MLYRTRNSDKQRKTWRPKFIGWTEFEKLFQHVGRVGIAVGEAVDTGVDVKLEMLVYPGTDSKNAAKKIRQA